MSSVLHEALMADVVGDESGSVPLVLAHLDGEWLAEDFVGRDAEHVEERLVGERQLAGFVAPDDRLVLRVEQRAIARLVLVELPLRVLQLLQAPLDARAHAGSMRSAPECVGRPESEMEGDEPEADAERDKDLQCGQRAGQQREGSEQARQAGEQHPESRRKPRG